MMQNKNAIRREVRQQRRALSTKVLQQAEQNLANNARQCRQLWAVNSPDKKLLSYAPFEGEISPRTLVSQLGHADLYHPRITHYRHCQMQFFRANAFDTYVGHGVHNRYGIVEPKRTHSPIFANQLNVVLVPLVAFDRSGNRMGMGAGYYDRALSALNHQTSTRPWLIGLAHHFQEVEKLDAQAWDVPLDAIITDQEYIAVSSRL